MLVGRSTCARFRPASLKSCWIDVVTGGFVLMAVWPGEPTEAVNVGENGTASQPVGVKLAVPVAGGVGAPRRRSP